MRTKNSEDRGPPHCEAHGSQGVTLWRRGACGEQKRLYPCWKKREPLGSSPACLGPDPAQPASQASAFPSVKGSLLVCTLLGLAQCLAHI